MKATKAQVQERVEDILRIRLDGAEFHDIVQYASEKGWGVGERQLWNYVQAADQLLAQRLEKDRDKLFTRHIAQRRALYARAVNAADYSAACRILRNEAELLDLYPAKKAEVTGKGGAPVQLHIVEEVVSREAPALETIVEEVVTHGTASQENPPPPGTASLPQE